jgi:hypothetical protein
MRVKLAAKMLVIARTLMKKKEVFDPDCIEEVTEDYSRRESPIMDVEAMTSCGTLRGLSPESCSLDTG